MKIALCNGYRCGLKNECLRNARHLEHIESEGKKNSKEAYINSLTCVKHRNKNYIPKEVYDDRSK
jgi:hypothetical protein